VVFFVFFQKKARFFGLKGLECLFLPKPVIMENILVFFVKNEV